MLKNRDGHCAARRLYTASDDFSNFNLIYIWHTSAHLSVTHRYRIWQILGRSDHVAIIMGRRRGSLQGDIFELVEITWGLSAAVGASGDYMGSVSGFWCIRPPGVDFSETHRIAYLATKMSILAPRKIFRPYSQSVNDPMVTADRF